MTSNSEQDINDGKRRSDMLSGTRNSSHSSLLGLPVKIRARILRLTGLRRACPIEMVSEHRRLRWTKEQRYDEAWNEASGFCPFFADTKNPYESYLSTDEDDDLEKAHLPCIHRELPINILYSCRTLCTEATNIMYGENSFWMPCDFRRLTHFKNLRPSYRKNLRHLHVTVYDQHARCLLAGYWVYSPPQSDRCNWAHDGGAHDGGAHDGGAHDGGARKCWNLLWDVFRNSLEPNAVNFALTGWVLGTHTVRAILKPLKDRPLHFKALNLDLSGGCCYKPGLTTVLRSTIAQVGARLTAKYFPLDESLVQQLPLELQLLIVRHTVIDHDTGYGKITFDYLNEATSAADYFRSYENMSHDHSDRDCEFSNPNGRCCEQCRPTRALVPSKMVFSECSCDTDLIWSSTCKCPKPPRNIFQVCKAWREFAMKTCCLHNEFVMRNPERTLASLKRLPRTHLAFLRTIVIVSRSYFHDRCPQLWFPVLKYLAEFAPVGKIHLKWAFTSLAMEKKRYRGAGHKSDYENTCVMVQNVLRKILSPDVQFRKVSLVCVDDYFTDATSDVDIEN